MHKILSDIGLKMMSDEKNEFYAFHNDTSQKVDFTTVTPVFDYIK